MMKTSTLRKMLRRKDNYLLLAMLGLLFVFGCYEFSLIDQPTEANNNGSFDVSLVMKEDADGTNDWTDESGDLTQTGLFGVLIPTGWTVDDNIAVSVKSNLSDLNGSGETVTTETDHSGDYTLVYSEAISTRLTDSIGAPDNYFWWGASTSTEVDMAFFDSLSFTITVNTDNQLGDFYLQYTVGDVEYWERNPMHYKSDPMQISIVPRVGINEILNEESISLYPNPSYGNLNIDLNSFNGEPVQMNVYNMMGKQVMTRTLTDANTLLDIVDLVPGVYVMRLETENETMTQKFQKR